MVHQSSVAFLCHPKSWSIPFVWRLSLHEEILAALEESFLYGKHAGLAILYIDSPV